MSGDIEGWTASELQHGTAEHPVSSPEWCAAILADHSRLLERVKELEEASRNTGNHLCGSRDEQTVGATAALAPGWVLMPCEATGRMGLAGLRAFRETDMKAAYRAMIANAPAYGAANTQASASGGADTPETGWLIEEYSTKTQQLKARWWNGEAFTTDNVDALRFARRQDAQRYIDDIGWTEAVPTEHRWG